MRHVFFPALCLAPLAFAQNSSFVPGTTCSELDPSHTALLGKHLTAMELAWAPFAAKDPTAPKGWTGYNIELMDELASLLGFTYSVVDIGYPTTGQTWTEHAIAYRNHGDVIMSFWFKNAERLKTLVFLDGHINVSPVLIARREQVAKDEAWSINSVFSFMLPFTWNLWGCLVVLVLCSGIADFIIERKASGDARLHASLYEYAAGFLWGGFEYPMSGYSAVFQIMLGFILLIVVSTYTVHAPCTYAVVARGREASWPNTFTRSHATGHSMHTHVH